ncbi:hypothetical protein QA596_01670 [Balneolales bacterium ANBcel1]|nr:hypothetical protein [Balneolales bacterium ANBcel1]
MGDTRTRKLKQALLDAREGQLNDDELERLRQEVMNHDPSLWDDYLWMMEQEKPGGLFNELSELHRDGPDDGAVSRFYRRLEAGQTAGADLEPVVWNWFRRYVLTTGILMILLLTGWQTIRPGVTQASAQQQLEQFMGWDQQLELSHQDFPELNHWIYEDLQ